jgi:halimadienyl-diphosphate synthase
VLDIAKDCPAFPQREKVIERLIQFLKKKMNPEGFWLDKWHISPYYTTAHAVITLSDVEPALAEKAVSWIQKTQNENGLWGENNGTLEETAYAVQAILYYHHTVERLDISTIKLPRLGHGPPLVQNMLPDLWIGKVLYTPVNVIFATIASAQTMLHADRTPVLQQRGEVYGKTLG